MLPTKRFYLFGMGSQPKFLYRDAQLLAAPSGHVVRSWSILREQIVPAEYTVLLQTISGEQVVIREDEAGIWIDQAGRREPLAQAAVRLPRFEGNRYAPLLRTLHHDVLVNILPVGPVPNLLVYRKPWYRDAAMMALCLERTGNVELLRPWIEGLREPFDHNNAGHTEPDNLGQALYLVSLVADAKHPLVERILRATAEFRRDGYIVGITDGREHRVYQTKWLKYGLRRLGLDDPYEVPLVPDTYSCLFWMDYREAHVSGPRFGQRTLELYPYLNWAEAHFYQEPFPALPGPDEYPITWETKASEAHYPGMAVVSPEFVAARTATPHAWHAAEMFLYLLERGSQAAGPPGREAG